MVPRTPRLPMPTKHEQLEAFLRKEYPSLVRFAGNRISMLGLETTSAEDLVQTVLVEVLERNPDKVLHAGYLRRAIAFRSVDAMNRERKSRLTSEGLVKEPTFAECVLGPDEFLLFATERQVEEEFLDVLWSVIGECLDAADANEKIRMILDPSPKKRLWGRKPKEIGKLLGISPRTVSNYLVWIRKHIYPCAEAKLREQHVLRERMASEDE